jgi:hypothetical protein
MFEIFMFWFWVSALSYTMLIGPFMLLRGVLLHWFEERLKDTKLEFSQRTAAYSKVEKAAYWPTWKMGHRKHGDFWSDAAPIMVFLFSFMLWVISCIAVAKEEEVTTVAGGAIWLVTLVATHVAEFTYWLAPVVIVWLAINYTFTKTINFYVKIKSGLDKLAEK